jgi:hypothetical protein
VRQVCPEVSQRLVLTAAPTAPVIDPREYADHYNRHRNPDRRPGEAPGPETEAGDGGPEVSFCFASAGLAARSGLPVAGPDRWAASRSVT